MRKAAQIIDGRWFTNVWGTTVENKKLGGPQVPRTSILVHRPPMTPIDGRGQLAPLPMVAPMVQ